MIDVKQWVKEIRYKQENDYVLECLIKLIINRTNMNDEEVEEFLEAVKGGWY